MKRTPHTLETIQSKLYSAVISDALDGLGYRNQSPNIDFRPYTGIETLVGRCKTTLWADIHHEHPKPYEFELMAVDASQPGDIIIAASS